MNKKEIIKLISEEVSAAFASKTIEPYEGQNLIVHEVDFNGDESWISFNVEGETFPVQDETDRVLKFTEDDFKTWLSTNEDVSEYQDKDFDFSPEERTSAPYSYFDYEKWKEYNDPEDYIYDFLIYKLKETGLPQPHYQL